MKKLIIFILTNFGPLVGFYLVNQFWGFKEAVIVSIVLVFVEFIILKYKKQDIGSFFYFLSAIIFIFGVADLVIQEPFFFKFEATLTNLFFVLFFGISLFKEKSIIQEFAEAKNRALDLPSEDKKYFFRLLTIFWCAYFVLKAFFYLWVNLNTSMNEALLVRMLVGKISFWVMMFISVGLSRPLCNLMMRFKMFPSQKSEDSFAK